MRKLLNKELGRITPEEYRLSEKNPVVIVLDNVRSLLNTGSVFRTADAFKAEAVFLCGITGSPPRREISKTALGADSVVSWKYYVKTSEAVHDLRQKGYKIISVEQTEGAVYLSNYSFHDSNRYAFIFGHEVNGVSQEIVDMSDACIEIPQFGTKHSLNIAVAAGIILWEIAGKRAV